ncbi:MAG: hypothetical protein JWO67_5724 [Streptosporangiaceae bacterium]|jgi:hypothetical protein|nr:hypothetical protein [Streptosporangiaceae bacterium]
MSAGSGLAELVPDGRRYATTAVYEAGRQGLESKDINSCLARVIELTFLLIIN